MDALQELEKWKLTGRTSMTDHDLERYTNASHKDAQKNSQFAAEETALARGKVLRQLSERVEAAASAGQGPFAPGGTGLGRLGQSAPPASLRGTATELDSRGEDSGPHAEPAPSLGQASPPVRRTEETPVSQAPVQASQAATSHQDAPVAKAGPGTVAAAGRLGGSGEEERGGGLPPRVDSSGKSAGAPAPPAQAEVTGSRGKLAVATPSSSAPSSAAIKGTKSPRDSGGVQSFSNSSNESSPQLKATPAPAASESHKPSTDSRLRRPAALARPSPPRAASPRASEVDDEVLDFEELPE